MAGRLLHDETHEEASVPETEAPEEADRSEATSPPLDGAAAAQAESDDGGAPRPPYRAHASRDGEQWHLTVSGLDDHPDRGEVDAVVITVTPDSPDSQDPQDSPDGFPAAELDRTLDQCGFARDGEWTRADGRWTAGCRQPDIHAAPPAPPLPSE
ncbi:hypothetical protein [Streptomyces sp. CA-111067]|uniref:hypothetical protein n=1 Tax=Streptomyces sp. CA-111067 TaxID=3240046 RepID=UPI003D95EA19